MAAYVDPAPVIIVPNLNGIDDLPSCIESLLKQTLTPHIIVVENASTDGSLAFLRSHYPKIEIIVNTTNLGYAGGVNLGFTRAIELGAIYSAPFNNDAVADKHWLERLVSFMDVHPKVAASSCKVLSADGKQIDSTGDYYTNWGLPYPRGRGETTIDKYDTATTTIFAASGAASLFRVSALREVGLFDEKFFAYYEDVDLSFRLQLAGWLIAFVPGAIVYHATGSTSSKMKGFTTYQTMKNQPLLLFKNVPRKYLWTIGWRFFLAHCLFFARAVSRGDGWVALKGDAKGTELLFKGFSERRRIQNTRTVSDEYVWRIITHDLPPNAYALRLLRARWWKLRGKLDG
jgi:GT2 family glycosyltransferase